MEREAEIGRLTQKDGEKNRTRKKKDGVGDRDVGSSDTHGNVWWGKRHRSLTI